MGDLDVSRNGSTVNDGFPNSGMAACGDCMDFPLCGSFAPLTRSGDRGNRGVPGEAGNFVVSMCASGLLVVAKAVRCRNVGCCDR